MMNILNMKAIGEVATIVPGATNSHYDKEVVEGAALAKLLTGRALTDQGCIDLEGLQTVWLSEGRSVERFTLQSGDVVLMARGTGVRAGLITDAVAQQGVVASSNFLIIRPNSNEISGAVLTAYLNSELGKSALVGMGKGSVIPSIPASGLRSLMVPVPSTLVQEQVADLREASQEAYRATLALAEQQQKTAQARILNLLCA